MSQLVDTARRHLEHPTKRKFVKYSAVSVISLLITQVLLFVFSYTFHIRGGRATLLASAIAAFPSYYLNRSWVWAKTGRSRIRKEVIPFWAMVFIGLGVASFMGMLADLYARDNALSREARAVLLQFVNIASFGLLWVGKFVIFNKILFAHRPADDIDPVLDGRSGVPT